MDYIKMIVFIWLISVFLIGCKMLLDQKQLLKLLRKEIDPPYPLLPGEKSSAYPQSAKTSDLADLLGITITGRRLRLTFSNYPHNQNLDKLAGKVRTEFFTGIWIGIGGFVLIVFLAFINNS